MGMAGNGRQSMTEQYMDCIRNVRRFSERSVQIYSDVLSRYCGFAGSEEVTVEKVRAYEISLMDDCGASARTVSLHLSVLSGYCNFLVKKGLMASNPVRLVPRPKQKKRLPEFYRGDAMAEYFESTKGAVEFGTYDAALGRIIITLLYSTGIRRSELISLNRDSFDVFRRILKVHGKGDKTRIVPVPETSAGELAAFLSVSDATEGHSDAPGAPLVQTKTGGRLYPVLVDRTVKRELGGIADITCRKSPHVLRHTIASELLGNGADLNSIKEFLGHSSLAATQVYTHSSIERLRSVYDKAHPRAKSEDK